MANLNHVLPNDGETIAELRELYRAAEARAARLRLLSASGRELAEAGPDNLDLVLNKCAERLAFFVGCRAAKVELPGTTLGIPVHAPGQDGATVGRLVIEGLNRVDDIPDHEDRDAFRMQLEMIGTTIERINTERERSVLLARLQDREQTLQILVDRIFTAQEEERRRVSHELHDGVAQTATALVRLLEGAEAVNSMQHDCTVGVSPANVARGLVSELRRVIAGLRPTLLDDLGLLAALHSLADGLEQAGFTVTRDFAGSAQRLSPPIETALFRVAQEAIANIHKHAGGPCEVTLAARLNSDPLVIQITDSGCGPSEATRASSGVAGYSVGINVMKERMTALGGTLNWRAGKTRGVTLEAVLPHGDFA